MGKKGSALPLIAGIIVIILVISAAVYYGSTTGYFALNDSQGHHGEDNGSDGIIGGSGIESGDDESVNNIVIGRPVINDIDGPFIGEKFIPEQPLEGIGHGLGQEQAPGTSSGSGSAGDSGSGGSGGSDCTPEWQFSAWSKCSEKGLQTRTATDFMCNTGRKTERRECEYMSPEPDKECTGICVLPDEMFVDFGGISDNDSFEVDIFINTTEYIIAIDLILAYDKRLLVVEDPDSDIIEGDFLARDGAETFPFADVETDGNISRITFVNVRYDTDDGIAGDGTVVTMTLKPISIGIAKLEIEQAQVFDTDSELINISNYDGIVQITQ